MVAQVRHGFIAAGSEAQSSALGASASEADKITEGADAGFVQTERRHRSARRHGHRSICLGRLLRQRKSRTRRAPVQLGVNRSHVEDASPGKNADVVLFPVSTDGTGAVECSEQNPQCELHIARIVDLAPRHDTERRAGNTGVWRAVDGRIEGNSFLTHSRTGRAMATLAVCQKRARIETNDQPSAGPPAISDRGWV